MAEHFQDRLQLNYAQIFRICRHLFTKQKRHDDDNLFRRYKIIINDNHLYVGMHFMNCDTGYFLISFKIIIFVCFHCIRCVNMNIT